MKAVKFVSVLVVAALVLGVSVAEAGKPINRPERLQVGDGLDYQVIPDLDQAVEIGGERVWAESIRIKDAYFVKAHLVGVNLRAGDVLVLRSATGHVVETITGRGPKGMGTFWSLSARGEELHLELHVRSEYAVSPFRIDKLIVGNVDPFGSDDGPESICPPGDFEDVVCYEADAGKWANVMASVGVMWAGGNPATGALWCSGSNVSPLNYVLTNDHCIESQADCDSAEFVFKYYNTTCGGSTTTDDWQGFRCDDVVVSSPFVSCEATLTTLDFALNSVIGDPASSFGYAQVDATPITDGEGIYIVQHPNGRPHEITHGDGANVDADAPNLRYYDTLDTEGGSSGSPIFRDSDDKLIGLHHCGGCTTPGTGNRGMMMSDIYPHIADYVCSPTLDLVPGTPSSLVQVAGNNNAIVEPQETWAFSPSVSNTACDTDGLVVASDISVNVGSTGTTSIANGSASFGDVAAGSSVFSAVPVEFTVGGDAVCGESVIFDMGEITAGNGGPFPGASQILTVSVGELVRTSLMLEDFASGIPVDWTVVDNGSGGGDAATWTTDNPGNRSLALTEPFAIVDSDNAGSGATQDEELISPVVDCTGYQQVELQFKHDFNYYASGQNEQADVEVRSSATGGAWVNVANYSGADTSGTVIIDITDHAFDQTDVQVRFHYYDGSYEYWWAVDDIEILGGEFVCESYIDIFSDDFEGGDATAWDRVTTP
ncbi:MAG: trypsin-like peptidase domain-containing protein [Thermoanaerobaculales bacterium]|jgi:hypothetical protein|nr:trypsin-like peptidase domain-containing protein [Thermoanaerobaculales bacterium]